MSGWGLEVVRGREIGRVFPVVGGTVVLGNELNGEPGIDLGSQEGSSPRRMAPRQAILEGSAVGLTLRDLESPVGTFVNRQRLLSGQARTLQDGDVLQLGSVQLKVVARQPAPPTESIAPRGPTPTSGLGLSSPFRLSTGATCRAWDDFLTASAQNWRALREELETGRLDAFLRSIGRDDLRPSTGATSSDERLDAWLGRLPTTRPAAPDLDVHPTIVRVRAMPGGGVTRSQIVITSTGYRLLRSSVRVEPSGAGWLTLAKGFSTAPFPTAETTDVPLEIEVPESLGAPRSGFLTIESNGGTRRVEVRIEPAVRAEPMEGPLDTVASGPGLKWRDLLEKTAPTLRFSLAIGGAVVLRLLIAAGDWLGRGSLTAPSLPGVALLGAILGGVAGLRFAAQRGTREDWPPATFAGACAGVLFSTLLVAVCRSIEPSLSRSLGSLGIHLLLWIVLGIAAALASLAVVPFRAAAEKGGGA